MRCFRRRRPIVNVNRPVARAFVERLETRQLLSADVWSGAGADALFSDAANWQGGVAPTSGQAITFPTGVAKTTVTVDSAVTVGNIEFDAAYTLSSANPITVVGNFTVTAGTTTVTNPIVLGQTGTFFISGSSAITLNGAISGTSFGIIQQGAGTLTLGGTADTYTGATTVDGGTLIDLANLTSAVSVSGNSTFDGNGSVSGLTGDGGTIAAVDGAAIGTITVANNLALAANAGNTLGFDIGGPGASSSIVVNAGTISLGNAALTGTTLSSYTPTAGDVITLITNNTGSAILGTFANHPQGSTVSIGGESYVISYIGGATANDVTLTASAASSAVTLSISKTPIYEGQHEILTATVTGASSLTGGTVTFYANFAPLYQNTGNGLGGQGGPGNQGGQTTDQIAVVDGKATLVTNFLPAGADSIFAAFSGFGVLSSAQSAAVTVNVRNGTPPIIESATPLATTHGLTIGATVYATDINGDSFSDLTYSWTTIHAPAGAKNPTFNVNNSNLASSIIARFTKDGGYTLQCKVINLQGDFVTTKVFVIVSQKATSFDIDPRNAQIPVNTSQQYYTIVKDQFGRPMRAVQHVVYRVATGPGSISSAGIFSATHITGAVTIEVLDRTLIALVDADVVS